MIVCRIALVVLAYTYVGYPLVIMLLAKLFPLRLPSDDAWTPHVSALVPVHDGAAYLARKLDSLLALEWPKDKLQILVYSDGSTDATTQIARDYAQRDARVQLIDGGARAGKPTALNRMVEQASGDVLLMTDVRQPLEPPCLRALVRRLAPSEVACVSGNLVLPTNAGAGVYWHYENALRNRESRFRSMLGVTGPIYALRKADLGRVPPDVILDDMFIPLRLRLAGRRLLFAADAIAHDQAFDDQREFGRKVRTLAGQYQLLAQLPRVLFPWSNPSWFEFVSHKLMRLACPWALVVLFIALPGYALQTRSVEMQVLAAGQLAMYVLALVGQRFGKLGQLARTFVVLNAAAVLGLWRQLTGRQRVTW